mgnify:CR=1 FL=1
MKVKELILELQKLDQEAIVIGPGYEGGYYDVSAPTEKHIELNRNSVYDWWMGPHDDIWGEGPGVKAYLI